MFGRDKQIAETLAQIKDGLQELSGRIFRLENKIHDMSSTTKLPLASPNRDEDLAETVRRLVIRMNRLDETVGKLVVRVDRLEELRRADALSIVGNLQGNPYGQT